MYFLKQRYITLFTYANMRLTAACRTRLYAASSGLELVKIANGAARITFAASKVTAGVLLDF